MSEYLLTNFEREQANLFTELTEAFYEVWTSDIGPVTISFEYDSQELTLVTDEDGVSIRRKDHTPTMIDDPTVSDLPVGIPNNISFFKPSGRFA